MKYMVAILGGTAMWLGADAIFANHLALFTAPWWREIFIMGGGAAIALMLNY